MKGSLLVVAFGGSALASQTVDYDDNETDNTNYNLTLVSGNYLILNSTGTGDASQAGTISNAGTVEKTGLGTINLNAVNTFSGTFILTSGTIGIGDNAAFGSSTIVINGGEIRAYNAPRTVGNALTLNSSFTVGRLTTFTGNATLGNSITITANNPDAAADGDSTFNGVISGSGKAITIAEGANGIGTGSIVFGGANTYDGGTTISSGRLTISSTGSLASGSALTINGGNMIFNNTAQTLGSLTGSGGTLNLGAGHTLTVAAAADGTFAGVITDAGNLIKSGAGTLTLSGANTYTGATTIAGGTLLLSGSGTINNSNLVLNGGLLAASGTFSRALGTGAGQVQFGASGGGFAASGTALSVTGLTGTPIWGSTANFLPNGAPLILNWINSTNVVTLTNSFSLGSAARTITVNDNAGSTADGAVISGVISGDAGIGFIKNGAGSLTLSAANTYSGTTTVSAGTLRASTNAAALGTGALVLNGGALTLASDGAVNFGRNTTVSVDTTITSDRVTVGGGQTQTLGTLSMGANTLTIARGALATSGTGTIAFGLTTLTGSAIFSLGASTQLNVAGLNESGGSYGVTVNGPGLLNVTANGNYTGATTINSGGILNVNNLANGGATSPTGMSTSAASNLVINGGSELRVGGGGATNTDRLFTLGIGGGSITQTGSGFVNFNNIGNVVLTGTNTARTLTLGGTAFSPNSFFPVLGDNGTGATSLVKSGTIPWILRGANTYTGGTTVTGGTLALFGSGSISSGNLLLNGGVLALAGSSTLPLGTGAGQVQFGASGGGFGGYGGPLTVTTFGSSATWGTSDFLPSGAPLILGSTIADNTVTLATNIAMGSAARTVTVNDNTAVAADVATLSGILSGDAGIGFIKNGAGTLILSGANTYTGATTISGGTLIPASAASISSANLVLSGGVLATMNGGPMAPTNFALPLGTGTGQVQFSGTGGGGFAAYGGPLTITGFTGTPVWASTANFLPNNAPLILSSVNADNVVTWTTDFSLGSAARTITVNDNVASTADAAVISGVISGDPGIGFTKSAAGQLTLGAANTYTGATTIAGGTLVISTIGNVGSGVSSLGNPATAGAGTIILGSTNFASTLRYVGTGATTDRVINIASGNNNATSTIDSSGTGPIVFTSALTAGPTFSRTLVLSGSNTGVNEIQGAIPNNSGTVITSLTKSGAGTWKISGANTYTGTTTITQGTLILGSSTALGNSPLNVNSSTPGGTAVLDMNGNAATITSLGIGGTAGGDATSVSNITGPGTLTLGGNVTFSSTGNPLGSTISANLNLAATTRTFTVNDSSTAANDLTISGAIGETATAGIIKANSGTLALTGANTFTGVTSITGGILAVNTIGNVSGGASSLGAPTSALNGTIAINGGTLRYFGTGATTDRVIDLPGTTTGGILDASGTGALVFTSALTASGAGSKALTLTGTSTDLNDFQGAIVNNSPTNTTAVSKSGAGIWRLSGANTYTGGTTLSAGTLSLGSAGALGTTGTITFGGGTLQFNAANTSDYSARFSIANNQQYRLDTNGQSVTLGSALTSSGGTFFKSGTGTLTLSGANTYTGATTINGGVLTLTSNTALPNTALNVTSNVAGGTAAFDLNGKTVTVPSISIGGATGGSAASVSNIVDVAGGGLINLNGNVAFTNTGNPLGSTISVPLNMGGGTRTFNVADSTTAPIDLTVSGIISASNTFGITKSGTGALLVSGTNTYNGPTNINQGAVLLGSATALPAASILNIYTNSPGGIAVLDLNGQSATTAALNVGSNSGGSSATSAANVVDTAGGGLLTLNGDVLYFNGNNPAGATISAALNLGSATRTFTVSDSTNASIDLTISGAISQNATAGLTKTGSGTMLLSGANTYTGATTVSNGALILGSSSALPNTSLTVSSSAAGGTAVLDLGSNNATVPSLTIGGASGGNTASVSNVIGAGTLILGGLTFNNTGNPLGSSISAALDLGAATRTFTVNDSTTAPIDLTISGVISGGANVGISKVGAGTLQLSGVNTYTGSVNVRLGTLVVGSATALPTTGTLSVNANTAGGSATLDLNGFDITLGGLNLATDAASSATSVSNVSGSGTIAMNGNIFFVANGNPLGSTISPNINFGATARTIQVNDSTTAATDLTMSGVISANAGVGVTKTGAGTLLLTGVNTYTGTTTVSAGTVALSGAGSIAGDINVATGSTFDTTALAGFTVGSGKTFTSNGTLNAGNGKTVSVNGTLKGSGTITGIVSVENGGKISPGNSPGILTTGDETWNAGGGYVWELNDASDAGGAKGVTYDWLSLSGTLALNSTSGSKFTIYMTSLTAGNTPGLVPNFVEGTSYSYTIATATTGITGFNPNKFFVDTVGFSNPIKDVAVFRVGNDLVLSFTAIPEPSTYGVAIAVMLGGIILFRRNRRTSI